MKKRVHIVASCADRKLLSVPKERRLRSHHARGSVSRFDSFLSALRNASGETRSARELYAGPYWAVVRQLPDVAGDAGLDARLWVASAGYGLVPADALLHGYSATFRSGERDSVASGDDEAPFADQLTAWWAALSDWEGPSRGAPRSVHELARKHSDTVVVLASPRYFQAMSEDLRAAAELLGDNLLVVTSYQPQASDPLASNVIPSQERLIGHVKGARPALHARVARHILEHAPTHPLSARALRTRYEGLARSSNYERVLDRTPVTDEDVRRFIRRKLVSAPESSHTGLLRALRDAGKACEQKRFRNLFHEEVRHGR